MNTSVDAVVDRIYEAALVPELWRPVIDDLSAVSGSATGNLFLVHPVGGAQGVASAETQAFFELTIQSVEWAQSPRVTQAGVGLHAGFRRSHDLLSREEIESDPVQHALRQAGLEAEVGTFIPMPSGEIACFSFQRRRAQGLHTAADLQALDRLRPHMARAAVMAARLGLARSRTMVDTLYQLGLPAAALSADGRVMAANAGVEQLDLLRPAAFGGLSLASEAAQALFQQALSEMRASRGAEVRSIPVRAEDGRAAQVLHLLPVCGAAHDVFGRSALLLIVTEFGAAAPSPDLPLLAGLFDLTPKEAQLASALASGKSLQDAALQCGIQYSTARTHLEHIFRKTGVRQQTQLVLLLQGALPLVPSAGNYSL